MTVESRTIGQLFRLVSGLVVYGYHFGQPRTRQKQKSPHFRGLTDFFGSPLDTVLAERAGFEPAVGY